MERGNRICTSTHRNDHDSLYQLVGKNVDKLAEGPVTCEVTPFRNVDEICVVEIDPKCGHFQCVLLKMAP
jgi:hypothetical protein